jgi:hypothetical protein
VRDVGLVAVQVPLVDEPAAVENEQGVRLGLGEQFRQRESTSVGTGDGEVVEGAGR